MKELADRINIPRLAERYEPTKNMLQVLNSALDPEVGGSINSWFVKAGIPRKYWDQWNKGLGFRLWWDKEFKKGMRRNMQFLDNIGMQKAKTDFRYWEAMQKKYSDMMKKEDVKAQKNTFIFNVPRPTDPPRQSVELLEES